MLRWVDGFPLPAVGQDSDPWPRNENSCLKNMCKRAEPWAVNMSPEFGQKIQGASTILPAGQRQLFGILQERNKLIAVYIRVSPVICGNDCAVICSGGSSQWAIWQSHSVVELVCSSYEYGDTKALDGDKTRAGGYWLSFYWGWRENA